MRFRCAIVFGLTAWACSAHAYMLQEWNKILPTSTVVNDVFVDPAGNTFVLGTNSTGWARLYVTKVSPTGVNLWSVLIDEGQRDLEGSDILVDAGGSIYIDYLIDGSSMKVRKLRGSDGVTLGTLEPQDYIERVTRGGNLVIDATNTVYWVTICRDDVSNQLALQIANVNSASLPSSTFHFQPYPLETRLLAVRPRPGGGVMVLTGIAALSPIDSGSYISTLYSFPSSGPPTLFPAGYATTFATIPGTTDVLFVGAHPTGRGDLSRHEMTADGLITFARLMIVDGRTVVIRDLHVSKFGTAFAVGAALKEVGTQTDSLVSTFQLRGGDATEREFKVSTPDVLQSFTSVRGDSYGTVTCVEVINSSTLKIAEVDPTHTSILHTRSYSITPFSSEAAHSVNAAGFTAIGMGSRIVGLKPRDLKDIYMGNTTYRGGTNATAIVRMYEPITSQRTVTLSDGGSPYVTIATSRVVLAGQTQFSATVLTNPVPTTQNITLTAKYGNQTRTFSFTLTP